MGEIEVLSLAKEKDGIAITDDCIARSIGEILGVKVHGTLYLIFLILKDGKIDRTSAINKVNEMSEFLRLIESSSKRIK